MVCSVKGGGVTVKEQCSVLTTTGSRTGNSVAVVSVGVGSVLWQATTNSPNIATITRVMARPPIQRIFLNVLTLGTPSRH